MKKFFFILFATISALVSKADITAFFSHCTFNTPDNKPYIETYLSVIGNSILFKKNANGKYQGQVEVGYIFSKRGQIFASKKYNLLSPDGNDTVNRPNFIDQQRFALDTGNYEMELLISDKNSKSKVYSLKKNIQIDYSSDKISMSEIEVLSSFVKSEKPSIITRNGYDLVPYNSDFFPENTSEISFYAEIYNLKKVLGEHEKILISNFIETFEGRIQLSRYTVFKKETCNSVNIVLSKMNIADLPSGNYNLVIQVKDKDNKIVAQRKSFFQRRNVKSKMDMEDLSKVSIENTFASRITGKDTLRTFLRSMVPIAQESEKKIIYNVIKQEDIKLMQQFFYNFWQTRNQFEPETSWKKYYDDVKAVNKIFGTLSYKGFETDRGRVYLQYGPPDKRDEYPNEPNAYPYEIWIYYTLSDKSKFNPNQTNKQFVFYTHDMVTNNFQLLHSDALGEIHEPLWDMRLHSRTTQSYDWEQQTAPEHYGGRSVEEFNNPK